MKTASSGEPSSLSGRARPAAAPAGESVGTSSRSLWFFVAAAFALLVVVYGVALGLGQRAQIREVPLARPGGRP